MSGDYSCKVFWTPNDHGFHSGLGPSSDVERFQIDASQTDFIQLFFFFFLIIYCHILWTQLCEFFFESACCGIRFIRFS